jgi:hypothetical protein
MYQLGAQWWRRTLVSAPGRLNGVCTPFLLCCLFSDIVSKDKWWTVNWKGFWGKWSWSYRFTVPTFAWRDWEKPRKPVMIACVPVEIRKEDTMLQAGRLRVRFPLRSLDFFQPHYGPGVDSASNRKEYQESSWGVKGGRRVRFTTSPTSVSQLYRGNVGASPSHTPMGFHGLLQAQLYLFNFTPPENECRSLPQAQSVR